MEKIIDRFIGYTKQHTTSDPESKSFPSTSRQLEFAEKLVIELNSIGLQEVELDENGYITATLPSNITEKCPVVGFIAHMDTSPDFSGENVEPQIVENYDGGTLVLNNENNMRIDPEEFPEILNYKGQTLITTNGKTLLGADDKAGIAEIITALEELINSTEIKHGKIRICFTPDEEIGKGADKFDVKKFGADFAYTIDGSELGELEYENFNAAFVKIRISGKSVHPGYAKNKMINAMLIANKIINHLPPEQRPEHTEKYEGFFHLLSCKGNVDQAEIQYIIRDHNKLLFETKKKLLTEIIQLLKLEFGSERIIMEMDDQYYNMKEKIEPVMYIVDIARNAMLQAGVEPMVKAIRGGTDGSRLSYMGLPCPNIFAGGLYFHGPYELIPVPSMLKAIKVIKNICIMIPQYFLNA